MSIEFVAQEFWDYVNESATPVAIKVIENNYLFIQIADLDYIINSVDYTSTISTYVSASTDYATISEYLTGNLTGFTNEQFSELISTWNATVSGGGGAIGASLLVGSYHTLVDGNSYPGWFVGEISSLVSFANGTNDALTYTAANINWLDGVELTLPDGTAFNFYPAEMEEVDTSELPALGGSGGTVLEDAMAYSVATEMLTVWANTITTDLSDSPGKFNPATPDIVFPTAILYWEMQMQWIRDRLRTVTSYLDHTVASQVVTLTTADNPPVSLITDPLFYRDWDTGTSVIRAAGVSGDIDFTALNGDSLPFSTFTTSLGSITVPKTLGPEQYDFENEQFYMYKSVKDLDTYSLSASCRLVSYTTSESYQFIASEPALVPYEGFYATKAALEAAIVGYTIWEADPTNAWSRALRNVGLVTVGRVFRVLDVVLQIRYSLDRITTTIDPCQYTVTANIFPELHYLWDAEAAEWVVDEDWPGNDPITLSACSVTSKQPTFRGFPIISPYGGDSFAGHDVPTLTVDDVTLAMPADELDFPTSATFNLINGTPAPVYPTYQGAFVYDLELKKWGKMKMSFLSLLDFAPVNTQSSQLLPNARYGVAGGIMDAEGKIFQWDANPSDAYIKYGKFSLFRLGVTTIQEIEAQFGIQSTGTIETETSLDGKTVDLSLSTSYDIEGARVAKVPVQRTGVWHNIIFRGQFDVTYLQVNGYRSGRR